MQAGDRRRECRHAGSDRGSIRWGAALVVAAVDSAGRLSRLIGVVVYLSVVTWRAIELGVIG